MPHRIKAQIHKKKSKLVIDGNAWAIQVYLYFGTCNFNPHVIVVLHEANLHHHQSRVVIYGLIALLDLERHSCNTTAEIDILLPCPNL